MARNNLTFRGSDPFWANACVGNNGHPTYVDYAEGFSKAANLMLDKVIENEGHNYYVDVFIYPICFNMRHSVELRLKGTVEQLQKLAKLKGKNLDFNLAASHDIGNIWNFIKFEAQILDKRYLSFLNQLDDYILDIADIDATGQTFRYPTDSEENRHLTNVSTINICVLKNSFSRLEKILDYMNHFNFSIEEEYALKTFTEHLSRAQLFELARQLPARNTWTNDNFANIKENIKGMFSISGKELSKAIKIIEKNYEMASLISALRPLKGATLDDLTVFFDEWIKFHGIEKLKAPLTEESISFAQKEDLEVVCQAVIEKSKIVSDCWEVLDKHLNPVSVSDLKALFYFGKDCMNYSENYVRYYEIYLPKIKSAKEEFSTQYKQEILHLLRKPNAFEEILKSLYFLGHSDLAEKLIEKYKFDECSDLLERIRNAKPRLANYENLTF